MRPDEFDRILSADDDIVPASGFAASVMDLVRCEASAPPPLAFPWGRLVLGLVALLGLAAWLAWSGVLDRLWKPVASLSPEAWLTILARALDVATRTGATWTAAALLLALVSSKLAMRLASPRA